jgi:HSP20 family protein
VLEQGQIAPTVEDESEASSSSQEVVKMAMLTYRDPALATPFRVMDELLRGWSASQTGSFTPLLDVREADDEYLVLVDLPGVTSDDVAIEISDRMLSISGSRAPVEIGEAQLSERPYGSFTRTLTLPQGVDEEQIVANYVDGVLELHVPKPLEQRPKKITIGGGSE